MSKNLVIVESPAKAKTIEGFLGKDFTVKSSFGHVRDLVKKGYGIDVEKNFTPTYEVQPDKERVIAELKRLSKSADMVWLASDEDREGEAISWHLFETLELDKKKTKRIVFHEITKPAIQKAIANPREIDINLVNAQQARRILDRLVGFELSPILWKKVRPSLSAGRVQSVAVRLIVEREREIQNFKSVSAFKVSALFNVGEKAILKAELDSRFKTEAEANAFLNKCMNAIYSIKSIETKPAKRTPSAPFTTSTLQQEAARKLGFSVSQTMLVAQNYMRQVKLPTCVPIRLIYQTLQWRRQKRPLQVITVINIITLVSTKLKVKVHRRLMKPSDQPTFKHKKLLAKEMNNAYTI